MGECDYSLTTTIGDISQAMGDVTCMNSLDVYRDGATPVYMRGDPYPPCADLEIIVKSESFQHTYRGELYLTEEQTDVLLRERTRAIQAFKEARQKGENRCT